MGNSEEFQKDITLAPLTIFKIGGAARYFLEATGEERFIGAIKAARSAGLPLFILGGGSNLLVSDNGFEGLVIKAKNEGIKIGDSEVHAEAGASLGKVVNDSIEAGLSGLEWAAGIPGTVGGAIRGNAGAYGRYISEAVTEVEILDESGATKLLSVSECGFGYRESVFKRRTWVILSAKLKLSRGNRKELERRAAEILAARRKGLPSFPSAGCIFKNLEARALALEVGERIPRDKIKGGMVPAGYLIEQCDLKGKQVGGAQISDQHANFIVNRGGAKATDVKSLIDLCKARVAERFEIHLEEEIQYLGF